MNKPLKLFIEKQNEFKDGLHKGHMRFYDHGEYISGYSKFTIDSRHTCMKYALDTDNKECKAFIRNENSKYIHDHLYLPIINILELLNKSIKKKDLTLDEISEMLDDIIQSI